MHDCGAGALPNTAMCYPKAMLLETDAKSGRKSGPKMVAARKLRPKQLNFGGKAGSSQENWQPAMTAEELKLEETMRREAAMAANQGYCEYAMEQWETCDCLRVFTS